MRNLLYLRMAANRLYSINRATRGNDISKMSILERGKMSSNLRSHPTKDQHSPSGSGIPLKADFSLQSHSMDRSSMLLVEANEISQYLQLNYAFSKCNSGVSCEDVEVLNLKQKTSSTWSLVRLKEKLVTMRKLMYAEDTEKSKKSLAAEVLFDQDDLLVHNSIENGSPKDAVPKVSNVVQVSDGRSRSAVNEVQVPDSKSLSTVNKVQVPDIKSLSAVNEVQVPIIRSLSKVDESISDNLVSAFPSSCSSLSDTRDTISRGIKMNSNQGTPYPTSHSSAAAPASHSASTDLPKGQNHITEKHLPIRSLSCHELRSSEKPEGLPERYLTGSSDGEFKKATSKSSTNSSGNHSGYKATTAPQIKNPIYPERNNFQKPSNYRPITAKKRVTSLQSCDTEVQTEGPSTTFREISTFRLCKDIATMTLTRFSYGNQAVPVVDRILCACESIRQGVKRLAVARSSSKSPSNERQMANLSEKSLISAGNSEAEKISVQVTVSLEVLLSHVLTWFSLMFAPNDSMIREQQQCLLHIIKELTKDIVTLWQSCEKEVDEIVDDSISKILNLLQQGCVECGKISAILDVCPKSLEDERKSSLEQIMLQKTIRVDDLLNAQPSSEVKGYFLSGCDIIVDKALQLCLNSTENIHHQIKSFPALCQSDGSSFRVRVFQEVGVMVTSCKVIFLQLQQVQIELYSKMSESREADKPADYHHSYFERCVSMIGESQRLLDSLELLKLAVQPLQTELNSGILRKVCRCSEMVQRSAERLLQTSINLKNFSTDGSSSNSSSVQSLITKQETSLCEELKKLTQTTEVLSGLIKEKLDTEFANEAPPSGDKVRRLLPVTPSRIQVLRCQSASICDQQTKLSKQFLLNNLSPGSIELQNLQCNKHWL